MRKQSAESPARSAGLKPDPHTGEDATHPQGDNRKVMNYTNHQPTPVFSSDALPLMPTHPARARRLMQQDRAVPHHVKGLFGSGWYVDADEFTKSFVAAAVSRFRAVGLEGTVEYFTGLESDFAGLAAAVDYYNSIETVEGEWSAFIVDGNGKIIDHYDKELVGRDLMDLFGVDMFEASEEGNWVATESLRLWVVSHDGLVFGSGWHQGESG